MCKYISWMGLCVFSLILAPFLQAAPKPEIAPEAWQLRFRFQDPQRISVYVPAREKPVVYWCMLYRVVNKTGQERAWQPNFELVTDTLRVVPAEKKVSPEAFAEIKRRAGDALLLPPEKANGRLLEGEERARHGVAIFRDFDPKAQGFRIYVEGLSGEMVRLKNYAFDSGKPVSEENPRYFTLRKTLEIPYKFPGSESARSLTRPERVTEKQRWIMR
jgi:hypothetical protein